MTDNKIKLRQVCLIFIAFSIALKIITLPSIVASISNEGLWISALLNFILDGAMLFFILKMSEKFKIWMWTAETDKGICTFEIRNHITAVKPLYDGRVLIKDANDNRYEIPDVKTLDKKSLKMILPKI